MNRADVPKLRVATLGCKVNQYETQLVREGLLRAGYADAHDGDLAQLCVVNTCTVTAEGDAKSRQVVRRLARENPGARIVVMGCYATRAPQELAALPAVVEVVRDKREIPDLLGRFGVVDNPDGISRFGDRHRAFVKVQDGCLLRCSYCIIPLVRPPMASRPLPQIAAEVGRLADNGYHEIVLTGIHLGHYGVDFNRRRPKRQWTRLSHLVTHLARLPGDFRIRLSSLEATELTHDLIDAVCSDPKRICPHWHVCLQSGSDRILQRMNRRWGSRRFTERCQLLWDRCDRPALTTDVIVGFPGETDSDFEATCQVVRACRFSKVHIFPFSSRRGTPAAEMDDPVPSHVIRQRCQELARVAQSLRSDYLDDLRGMELQVLVESNEPVDGYVAGTSCRYVPVHVPAPSVPPGQFLDVRARGQHLDGVLADPIPHGLVPAPRVVS